jgi:hypothetical protein
LKQIRKRLTYANVMSSIAVFLVLGGATALAAGQLGKNSVGSKQIKKNAVTAVKIKKNAVTTEKLAPNAITGAKVNLASLGTVPTATKATTATKADNATRAANATNADNATNAANLAGQQSFFVRLNPGQSQTLASNGAVSIIAQCATGVEATNDRVRIIAQTTAPTAILDGNTDLSGPGGPIGENEFLEPNTPEDKRVLVTFQDTSGDIDVSSRIDQGYVLGPEGKMITVNSEGIALGLNYGGTTCMTAGIVNLIG